MPYTGLIMFAFLIWHIVGIKFGADYKTTYDTLEVRDLHKLLLEFFGNVVNVAGYCVAMVAVGLHVLHGAWSAPQSLGINRLKLDGAFRKVALLFSLIVTIIFIT